MTHLITSPKQFADWFTAKVPGAHRQITVDDVRDMTTCGLIGKYGFYIQLDIQTVRGILQYELLRENRQKRGEIRDSEGIMHCRRCNAVVPRPEGRKGRPNEYCEECQPFRGRERNRKWRIRQAAMAKN